MRECICCHKNYDYCPTCPSDRYLETWHILYCSDNCRNLFSAVNDFVFEKTTKEEAKELIEKCDLSVLESCAVPFQQEVKKILAYDHKKSKQQ